MKSVLSRGVAPLFVAVALVVPGLPAVGQSLTAPKKAAVETPGADVAGGPRIEFTTSGHDFGKRDAGPELKTTFEFKNVGDDVLQILRVKGG